MGLLHWFQMHYSIVLALIGLLISFFIGLMLYGIEGTKLVFKRLAVNLVLYAVFALFFSSNIGSAIFCNINDCVVWTKHYLGSFLQEKRSKLIHKGN